MNTKTHKKDFDGWNIQKRLLMARKIRRHFTNEKYGLLKLERMSALNKTERVMNF